MQARHQRKCNQQLSPYCIAIILWVEYATDAFRTPGYARSVQFRRQWLPDSYSQIFRLYFLGPLGLKDYGSAMLRCKIWSLPFLALCPHTLHPGAIQGKEGFKICYLATLQKAWLKKEREREREEKRSSLGAISAFCTISLWYLLKRKTRGGHGTAALGSTILGEIDTNLTFHLAVMWPRKRMGSLRWFEDIMSDLW